MLDPFEVTAEFPIRDAPVGLGLLPPGKVEAMANHSIAERRAQNRGLLERGGGFRQRCRNLRRVFGCVGVAGTGRTKRQFILDAMQPCRDQGGIGEVRNPDYG
jgi:hypothetical protein